MTLLYTGKQFYTEAPSDEGDVRSTVTIVDGEDITPTATADPEYNHVETDVDTEGGLTTRDLSSRVHASEQYVPAAGNANADPVAAINAQVSTAGAAPAKEASGVWGHGSAYWQDSTEPTIRDGAEFNDVYFSANRPTIQEGTLDYMIPNRYPDDSTAQSAQEASVLAARKAASAAMYQRFLDDRTN